MRLYNRENTQVDDIYIKFKVIHWKLEIKYYLPIYSRQSQEWLKILSCGGGAVIIFRKLLQNNTISITQLQQSIISFGKISLIIGPTCFILR